MAIEVRLPDLGEGVEDATISRWLVQEGDEVSEGDALLEVATDKVDTEVPSPAAGKVLKINHGEGDLVSLDAVLLVLGAEGEDVSESGGDAQAEPTAPAAEEATDEALPTGSNGTGPTEVVPSSGDVKASPVARRVAADRGVDLDGVSGSGPGGRITKGDVLASAEGQGKVAASLTEPLPGDAADVARLTVARLAAENNIDLDEVAQGRPLSSLTRYDVLSAVASRDKGEQVAVDPRFAPQPRQAQADAKPQAAPAAAPQKAQPASKAAAKPETKPAPTAGDSEEFVKHSRMRQAVARNTTASLFSAPHVTTMWDVNMAAVMAHRKAHKSEFAAAGVNLTITAYFVEAILAGLQAVPAANATWTDEGVIIKRYYNIGMAVALPQDKYGMGGLIVPVIKNVSDLNLMGIARAVNEMAEKARNNQLRAEDLADGTFTLSNYGTSGSRFQTPVIVQPQVGILGVGAIEKRPIVVSQGHPLEANTGDYLTFQPMTTLGFSYDHRVLDGATADAFCAAVKQALESY